MQHTNESQGETRPSTTPSDATSETKPDDGVVRARSPIPMLVLTQSAVGTFLTCPRKYRWSYEQNIRKVYAGSALSLGTAYHGLLDLLNKGAGIDEAIAAGRKDRAIDEFDRTLAECMASGWQWRWTGNPNGKIICSEQVFEWKPKSKARWSIAGKIDAIVELPDGRVAVVEYKTTSDDLAPEADYWRRLLIDRQVSWYILGARSLGYQVDTVIYDVARKPGIKPKLLKGEKTVNADGTAGKRESMGQYAERLVTDITERPDWYYARQEIPRIQADLDETQGEMEMLAHMIRASRNAARWPRNTNSCVNFGRCAYFGPCSSGHDPETAGTPEGYRKIDVAHPELTINGQAIAALNQSEGDDHEQDSHSAGGE